MLTYPARFTVNAMLCDSAVVAEGKLYIQGGGWNYLAPQAFPFHQARVGLAVLISVPYTETNRTHDLVIRLEDEDGALVGAGEAAAMPDGSARGVEIVAQFNQGRPPTLQAGEAQVVPFAINLDQLRFDRAGSYAFVITIDKEEVSRLIFRITGPSGPASGTTGAA